VGCQVHVTDRAAFRPFATMLHIVKTVRDAYPAEFAFHPDYFDKVMGTASVRAAPRPGRYRDRPQTPSRPPPSPPPPNLSVLDLTSLLLNSLLSGRH
jgi:hypothetical protein